MFKDATPGNPVKTITSFDASGYGPPVTFEQASGRPIGIAIANGTFNTEFRRLDRIGLIWQFTLDVAAATVDTSNGANDNYWGEARALWTFNGTGNVTGPVGPTFPWTSDGAGVTSSTAWSILGLTPENVGGPIFNLVAPDVKFTPTN